MDQLDGGLHGAAGRLRGEEPGAGHRHRLYRGLCQRAGGEGECVVCDLETLETTAQLRKDGTYGTSDMDFFFLEMWGI